MFSKAIQFNRGKVVSVVLAVLMLVLATTPALAWFDEGDNLERPVQRCHIISDAQSGNAVFCNQVTPQHGHAVAKQPLLRPAIAKAEQMFGPAEVLTAPIVQATSNQ